MGRRNAARFSNKMIKRLLFWLALGAGVTPPPPTAQALFVRPPSHIEPFPALQLATADRLGARYRGIAYNAGRAASYPGFALTLDAVFENLDESTFLELQKAYCGWSATKSRVQWNNDKRTYTLLDFLPPLLQAVSGLHFQSSRTRQKGLPSFLGGSDDRVKRYSEQEVILTNNCWGFAWEVLFQADNADTSAMTVSTGSPGSAWRAFTGPGFDLIQSTLTKPDLLSNKAQRNKKLQAGDVLLLWHTIATSDRPDKVYLDHVVTWIDDDVIFEKSGSGDKVPFRLNTWEGLTANFPPSVFNWEWRRLVRNNRNSPSVWQPYLQLKPAAVVFGVESSRLLQTTQENIRKRFSLLAELQPSVARQLSITVEQRKDGMVEAERYTGILVLEDLVFDSETGRASLPPSAFQRQFVQLPRFANNPYRKS